MFWLHRFRGIDVTDKEQRQRLIDCFVNAVYLYDDKMVLTFNYKDGIKHTNFDDVKSSDLDESGRPKALADQGFLAFLALVPLGKVLVLKRQ